MKIYSSLFFLLAYNTCYSQSLIQDLSKQLVGTWTQKKENAVTHESWKLEEEVLFGNTITFKNGNKTFEEIVRLHKVGDDLYYSVATPGNGRWVDFKMSSKTHDYIKFENPNHDFPKSIAYRWVNADSIVATVGDGEMNIDFNYKRNNNTPCSSHEFSQFDFWIGEWDAFNPLGVKSGNSRITKSLDGCIVLEEWKSTSQRDVRIFEGMSINNYDSSTKKWNQSWIANHGEAVETYSGFFENNAMTLYTKPYQYSKDTIALKKLSFTKQDNGDVIQLCEILNIDQKKIKTAYLFTYKKKPIDKDSLFISMLDSLTSRYNRQDYMGVASMYHDDAEITGGNTYIKDRMNLDKYWVDLGTNYGGKWELKSQWSKIDTQNKRATQRGRSIITQTDGQKSEVEFILNWIKTIEGWKILQDIYW